MRAIAKIFCEHEQASTRLNFASKSSKGQILRAIENFYDHSIPLTVYAFCLSNWTVPFTVYVRARCNTQAKLDSTYFYCHYQGPWDQSTSTRLSTRSTFQILFACLKRPSRLFSWAASGSYGGSGNVTGLKFESRTRAQSRTRSLIWRSLLFTSWEW